MAGVPGEGRGGVRQLLAIDEAEGARGEDEEPREAVRQLVCGMIVFVGVKKA